MVSARDPILVLGCGAIGASAAAGWSARGHEVWGSDRRDLGALVARGWLRRQVGIEAVLEAGTIVLALPVGGILGALRRLPFQERQLVTDVGSVKGAVMAAAAALQPGVAFVGGHPMAGSEGSGFEAARPEMFAGAAWALSGSGESLAAVAALVRDLGATPLVCDAQAHDRAVALTSHVPQLLASALAAELEARAERGEDEARLLLALLGPAGRAVLRLAGSSYEVWRDILLANREEVEHALTAVRERAAQPPEALAEEFAAARRWFARLRGE